MVVAWTRTVPTGPGKSLKDAASVRGTHPIPAACGIYYYEIKIISKGKNGFVCMSSGM